MMIGDSPTLRICVLKLAAATVVIGALTAFHGKHADLNPPTTARARHAVGVAPSQATTGALTLSPRGKRRAALKARHGTSAFFESAVQEGRGRSRR